MIFPEHEAFVDSINLERAVIHNCKTHTAHHDLILPAERMDQGVVNTDTSVNIAVSCNASFELSSDKKQSQLKRPKQNDAQVDLLIWLYLGNKKREHKYQGNVVFMNGNGRCSGLA
jgi:hypothetical protein